MKKVHPHCLRKHKSLTFFTLFLELVFQVDPTIASGREAHIAEDAKRTTITNRSELMQSAVDAMSTLIRQHTQQQETIRKLTDALQEANTKCRLLQERSNDVTNSRLNLRGGLPDDGPRVRGPHDPLHLIDSATASQFQSFASDLTGNAWPGFGVNLPLMNRGPPTRASTLEALLSERGNRANPDGFDDRTDIFLRNSFLLQQQSASAYQPPPADNVASAFAPDRSIDSTERRHPPSYAFLQQLLQASGGLDRHDGRDVVAPTRSFPSQGVTNLESKRRKRGDDARSGK